MAKIFKRLKQGSLPSGTYHCWAITPSLEKGVTVWKRSKILLTVEDDGQASWEQISGTNEGERRIATFPVEDCDNWFKISGAYVNLSREACRLPCMTGFIMKAYGADKDGKIIRS